VTLTLPADEHVDSWENPRINFKASEILQNYLVRSGSSCQLAWNNKPLRFPLKIITWKRNNSWHPLALYRLNTLRRLKTSSFNFAHGEEVPTGQYRSADIGVLCQKRRDCVAFTDSVYLAKLLYIAPLPPWTGDALKTPKTVEVLLGTPVAELSMDHAESKTNKLHRLVMGGPMMGLHTNSLRFPIVKPVTGILAATKEELPATQRQNKPVFAAGMCEQEPPCSWVCSASYFGFQQKPRARKQPMSDHNLFRLHRNAGAVLMFCPTVSFWSIYRHSQKASNSLNPREINVNKPT